MSAAPAARRGPRCLEQPCTSAEQGMSGFLFLLLATPLYLKYSGQSCQSGGSIITAYFLRPSREVVQWQLTRAESFRPRDMVEQFSCRQNFIVSSIPSFHKQLCCQFILTQNLLTGFLLQLSQ